MIDPATLATSIQSQIATTVDEHIREYVGSIIRELSMDSAWIAKIEQQINQNISRQFGQKMSLVDINSLVAEAMDQAVARYYERNQIAPSIDDQADQTEMIITDGQVLVKQSLAADSVKVVQDAVIGGTLTVQDIAIKGSIATDNRSWQELTQSLAAKTIKELDEQWRQIMVDQVRADITASGIDFTDIMVAGQALIKDGALASAVTRSNLQTLGVLDALAVRGQADIADSFSVRPRRVGINTQHPDMALSVWDEEVALAFGKHKEQTAYLGTLRPQRLVIGINRSPAIDVSEQGRVTINHLTVGRHRVCHEAEIPNYSGTKGDIVFNSNPKGDGVWGWQCLGAFKWIPLRTAG